MNILVLGGTGYLGGKVVSRLLNEGHSVICVKREKSDLSRIYSAVNNMNLTIVSSDRLVQGINDLAADCVINMACDYGKDDPFSERIIHANLDFPLHIMSNLIHNGIKKYITIGTGLPDDFNLYSFSKKMLSNFGEFYVAKKGIDFCDLKLEMFYGSDEPDNRFIPFIIGKMLKGDTINMTLGTQKRDIIYVDDVVDAIMLVIKSDLHGYNEIPVGTGIAPRISEIVDYIWLETGRKSIVNKGIIPMRLGEPDSVADTSKIQKLGEWKPMNWMKGIRKMISIMEEKK